MLDIKELKDYHDKAYTHNQVTRERAADDLVFYWVTQWDDSLLGESQLQYRGEFNVLRKAGRQIDADLRANPVQVDFEAKVESRDDGADLIDGIYLTSDRNNTSVEAYKNAQSESVVCGVGAWELHTEYESNNVGDKNQVIRRKPIYEANNNCFWDPNAKLLDKSDAKYCSILKAYSKDGYRSLVEELTGEDPGEVSAENFKYPEQSYVFPWLAGGNSTIYVTTFYHKEKKKDKVYFMVDPFGQQIVLRESDIEKVEDELSEAGYEIVEEKEITRWAITRYIASGAEVIKSEEIAGENIPVVPVYGERAFVEGEEHYEGITRLAKDPQRLRNFQLSYLADIVSRSPRPKPIFFPEQIQNFEFMYEETGADNNYPYYLQNRVDGNGNALPGGPAGVMPDQPMPTALAQSIDLSRQAVEDVANPGLPQDVADVDISGKAVMALQNRLDQQSLVYQENYKHAKRRDGEIYASMAKEVYDAPRKVSLTKGDGSREVVQIMESVQDSESGEIVVLNDLTNVEFEVFADIGPSYSSKKEQTLERLEKLAAAVAATDPAMHKLLVLKIATMEGGVNMDDVRDYANKQLLISGFKQPENEEEAQLVAESNQQQSAPDPMLIAAEAENKKGQAALMREQRQAVVDAAKIENERANTNIDMFEAETDRISVMVDAEKAGAEVNYKNVQALGQRIDNRLKSTEAFRARVSTSN